MGADRAHHHEQHRHRTEHGGGPAARDGQAVPSHLDRLGRRRGGAGGAGAGGAGAGGAAVAGSTRPTILIVRPVPPRARNDGAGRYRRRYGARTTLDFDLATLRRAIGGGSYVRGTEYARQQAVLRVSWDPDGPALRGMVHGTGADVYHTSAFLTLAEGPPARFNEGECSCPVAYNCKHVVALVMSALASARWSPAGPRVAGGAAARGLGPVAGLAAGCGQPGRGARPGRRGPGALGIELALAGGPGQVHWGGQATLSLTARVVRPGRNGWVAGDLSWARLEALRLGRVTASRTCGCCASCTGSTRRPTTSAATATATARTGGWSSPPSVPASCGRCWTKRPRPA